MTNSKQGFLFFIFVFLFILHIPFLSCDPDINISFSRDAFTDEGLYTSQVRNYLISGDFNIDESDATVKSPLFSLVMLIAFKTGGISLEVARFAVLFLVMVIAWFVCRKDSLFASLCVLIIYLQYSVFHYSHFALAEILSVSMLFVGWKILSKTDLVAQNILLATFIVALAYYLKFQYLSMFVWPVLFYLVITLIYLPFKKELSKHLIKFFAVAIAGTLISGVIYYTGWYMPNRELFDYVMSHQAGAVYARGEWFQKMVDFNITSFYWSETMKPLTVLFLFCIAAFLPLLYYKRIDKAFVFQSLAAFTWCIAEAHKPALSYLPARYLIATWFAMGLFSVIIIKQLYLLIPKTYVRIAFLVLVLAWPVGVNVNAYSDSFSRRSFVLKEHNQFVKQNIKKGCVVVGPWAPSLTWMVHSKAIPLWRDYFNHENTIQRYNPCIIISEDNEADTDWAWRTQGTDPRTLAKDSSRFVIRDWPVNVYVVR